MTEPGPDDPSHALERFTEDELLDAVRAGDTGAYAELYRRHRHEALRLARSLGTLHDPDDVAQEAFLKVLKAILRGAGPRRGFAPYLLRTVRNEAIDRARRTHEDAVEDLEHAAPDSFVSPDGVDELFDRQLVRTAFEGLPETWRRILWLTEVEGETPRALAPQLGRSPNAISQLSRRAREGLRAAWLQAHLDVAGAAPTCRSVAKDLDAHENGRLDPARSAAVASHLETCTRCAAARDELRGLAVQLRAVLLPLVLGSPLLLEQLSADVAAVGPSADGGSAASASPPTASLDPLVGAGLVRGSLIAHAGSIATLGALVVLGVGGALMLGAAQEGATPAAGASEAAHPGADGEDGTEGGAGDVQGTGGSAGSEASEGTDPATATSDPDGIDGAESSTVSVDGSAGDDVTLSPVQLPVVAPGPDDASPAPPGTATPTPPQEPTSPAVPGPGPASADEDPAGPSAPVQDPTTGTPQEPPAQTEDDPSDPASEPAHAPAPPKQGPTQQPPLPGMPGGSPSDPPATVPTSMDPSPGDGQSSGGGGGDDSVGAPVVVEPGYAPGPQLPPAVEAPSDPPDEETAAF
jgi:RNA polymerase sigma factor (sigma-70 family)